MSWFHTLLGRSCTPWFTGSAFKLLIIHVFKIDEKAFKYWISACSECVQRKSMNCYPPRLKCVHCYPPRPEVSVKRSLSSLASPLVQCLKPFLLLSLTLFSEHLQVLYDPFSSCHSPATRLSGVHSQTLAQMLSLSIRVISVVLFLASFTHNSSQWTSLPHTHSEVIVFNLCHLNAFLCYALRFTYPVSNFVLQVLDLSVL